MDFDGFMREEPDFLLGSVAGVNHPETVPGMRIQADIMHPKRGVIEGLRVIHPRQPSGHAGIFIRFIHHQIFLTIHPGGGEATGIGRKAQASYQMRLPSHVAEIIVEAARPWIGPINDLVQGFEPLRFSRKVADPGELLPQPRPVIQRIIEGVQAGAPVHGNGLVFGYAQLHADTLKKGVAQFHDPGPPVFRHTLGQGALKNCLRGRQCRPASERRSGAQLFHGGGFQACFIEQSAAGVGIIIGAEQALLETPIPQVNRRGGRLHALELLQSGFHRLIGQERSTPVPFQSQQPLGKRLRVTRADEVTAVIAEDIRHAGF